MTEAKRFIRRLRNIVHIPLRDHPVESSSSPHSTPAARWDA
jgi:hypothetical protein